MPRLLSLIGYPAAGKSTYALELESEGFTVISGDRTIRSVMEREGLHSMTECYAVHRDEINETMDAQLREAIQRGDNIVFDVMNTSVKRRSMHLQMAKQLADDTYYYEAVVIHPPEEEEHAERLVRRLIRGEQDRAIDGFFQVKLESEYEPPTLQEGYDEIRYVGTPPKQPLMHM